MIPLAAIELGIVTRRDDPDGLGRVKIQIPGIIEPETPDWVEPLGIPGGGSAQRGTFDPPSEKATVGVLFHRGDINRPFYITGPYGVPGGAKDIPTGGEIEGADRANVVTEDAEWLIQRDSRSASAPQRYRIKHKSSGAEIVIEGNDFIRLLRQAAAQAFVRGTEYRQAETDYLSALHAALRTFAQSVRIATGVPQIRAAANVLYVAIASVLDLYLMVTDPTAYLSTKIFGE